MKQQIRYKFLKKRRSLSNEGAEKRSKKILERLKEDEDYKKAKVVMFYVSKEKEVRTDNLIKEELNKDKKIIVPKIHDKGLLCCEIKNYENMEFSCYGILEPKEEIICDISDIDIIIVPGVVFDKGGHRIGYGKGYYDRLLKNAKCKKIGLAYDFQVVDKIPSEKWDVKVDKVITD